MLVATQEKLLVLGAGVAGSRRGHLFMLLLGANNAGGMLVLMLVIVGANAGAGACVKDGAGASAGA